MKENVVKHNEFVYTREQHYTKVIIINILFFLSEPQTQVAHFVVLAMQNEVQENQDGHIGGRTHVEEPAVDGVLTKRPQHQTHDDQRQNECRRNGHFWRRKSMQVSLLVGGH